jgi:hypothetical protein
MKLKGKLTIARTHGGDGDSIHISIVDEDAAVEFVEAELTLGQFALAITGLGRVECEVEVRGLDKVGKRLELDAIEFPLQMAAGYANSTTRREHATARAKKLCHDGWIPDCSFSSQGSFFQRDCETWARCNVRRWVEKD